MLPSFISPLRHPLVALAAFELPLLVGLRPDSPWCVPGAALLLLTLIQEWRKGPSTGWNLLLGHKVLATICLLFVAAWSALIPLKYFSLGYSMFDTGIFAAELHLFSQTGRYWSSIQHMHALRDHFTPNLLLVSLLLRTESSFVVLHVLKLLAHVGSAFVLFRLSQCILGSTSRFRLAVPALWLVHSFVGHAVDFEFQPSALAVPFVLLAFLFAIQGRRFALLCTLIFLLGFKEHLSLVWISVGVLLLLKSPKNQFAWAISALGLVIGPLIYTQVMPLFESVNTPAHAARLAPFALLPEKVLLIAKAFLQWGYCLSLPHARFSGSFRRSALRLYPESRRWLALDFIIKMSH